MKLMFSIYNAIQLYKYKRTMKKITDVYPDNQELIINMINLTTEFMNRCRLITKLGCIPKIFMLIIASCIRNSNTANIFAVIMLCVLIADCLLDYYVITNRLNVVEYYHHLIREKTKENENYGNQSQ